MTTACDAVGGRQIGGDGQHAAGAARAGAAPQLGGAASASPRLAARANRDAAAFPTSAARVASPSPCSSR